MPPKRKRRSTTPDLDIDDDFENDVPVILSHGCVRSSPHLQYTITCQGQTFKVLEDDENFQYFIAEYWQNRDNAPEAPAKKQRRKSGSVDQNENIVPDVSQQSSPSSEDSSSSPGLNLEVQSSLAFGENDLETLAAVAIREAEKETVDATSKSQEVAENVDAASKSQEVAETVDAASKSQEVAETVDAASKSQEVAEVPKLHKKKKSKKSKKTKKAPEAPVVPQANTPPGPSGTADPPKRRITLNIPGMAFKQSRDLRLMLDLKREIASPPSEQQEQTEDIQSIMAKLKKVRKLADHNLEMAHQNIKRQEELDKKEEALEKRARELDEREQHLAIMHRQLMDKFEAVTAREQMLLKFQGSFCQYQMQAEYQWKQNQLKTKEMDARLQKELREKEQAYLVNLKQMQTMPTKNQSSLLQFGQLANMTQRPQSTVSAPQMPPPMNFEGMFSTLPQQKLKSQAKKTTRQPKAKKARLMLPEGALVPSTSSQPQMPAPSSSLPTTSDPQQQTSSSSGESKMPFAPKKRWLKRVFSEDSNQ